MQKIAELALHASAPSIYGGSDQIQRNILGEKDDQCTVRLKLAASVPEVTALAGNAPERYEVGTGGWTKMVFPPDDHPPVGDLERWITESFFLLAPKKVAKLAAG